MPDKLQIAAIVLLLALAGCGGRPATVVETSIEKCPPRKPTLDSVDKECPASFPDRGERLDALLNAWEDAALYALCKDELLRLWDTSWDECP